MTAVHTQSLFIQGIVIKRSALGENDQIFTLYSHELGKIKAAARGSLKPKSPFRGILEPFHQIQAEIVHSNRSSLYRLQSAEVIGRPSAFMGNLTALHTAYLILECLDRYCEPENPNSALYQETIFVLGRINRDPEHAGYWVRCFCFRFFALSGYAMEWFRCTRCGLERAPERSAYCLAEAGGVICSRCTGSDESRSDWIVESDVLGLAAAAADGNPVPVENLSIERIRMFEQRTDRLIRDIFGHYLDGVPRTLLMLEDISKPPPELPAGS